MANMKCSECSVDLEIGYIPDLGDAASVIQMVWHSSTPEPVKIFGLKTGSVKPSDKQKQPLPIWAFRCPNCGLLRLHAIPRAEDAATQ